MVSARVRPENLSETARAHAKVCAEAHSREAKPHDRSTTCDQSVLDAYLERVVCVCTEECAALGGSVRVCVRVLQTNRVRAGATYNI